MGSRFGNWLGRRLGGGGQFHVTWDDWHPGNPDTSNELAPTYGDWHSQGYDYMGEIQQQQQNQENYQRLIQDHNDMWRTLHDPRYPGCNCNACRYGFNR